MNPFSLENQHILIVGGSSGMGLATARMSVALGATVVLASHDEKKLNDSVNSLGPSASAVLVDVTKEESIKALVKKIQAIDHLFITAGPGGRSGFLENPIDDARDYLNGKFWSAYALTREIIRKIRKDGSVTYISGGLSLRPEKGSTAATVAQHAVEGLAKALAVELSPLRFNVIRPGMIDTDLWDFVEEKERNEMFDEAISKTPSKRVGKGEDIAKAAIHFMVNTFANALVMDIDGGLFLS